MEKVYKYFDKRGKACKVTADGEIEEVFQSTVEQLKEMKFVKEE